MEKKDLTCKDWAQIRDKRKKSLKELCTATKVKNGIRSGGKK